MIEDELLNLYSKRHDDELRRSSEYTSGYITIMYPQYSLEQAASMPEGDKNLLIRVAKMKEIDDLASLVTAMSASGSKQATKQLLSHLEKERKKYNLK